MATLSTAANEKSTYVVTVDFKNEDGDAVTPNTVVWSLTDTDGNVINSRDQVSISNPSSSEDIVLNGDDLQLTGSGGDEKRRLIIEATYDSSYGAGLYLKEEIAFTVKDLAKIT